MKFGDLKTGDVLTLAGQPGVVMAIDKEHPMHPGFWLVIWYLPSEKRLSFDALHPDFDLIPGSKVHQDGFHLFNAALAEIAIGHR